MRHDLIAKYDQRVPRYTSYPTAPHFHPGVDATRYRAWLGDLGAGTRLSLYVHIPYCDSLCWFCGCHTKIVRRYGPIARYLESLGREIDLVADAIGERLLVSHVHWGGASPTILTAEDVRGLAGRLRRRFAFAPETEFAVEIDPRGFTEAGVAALAEAGVSRASLGVQDVNPEVQRAVNRIQPVAETARLVGWLRAAGIEAINVDLMYGLPHQTVARVIATVEAALDLAPDRIALFGYAHVPWMKRHQAMIDEAALPDAQGRIRQFEAAVARLEAAGYRWLGLDHFARADDSLALAAREGRLHRNFQGYTTDDAPALIGLGASAIGALPQGYVQNAVPIHAYRAAVDDGCLASVRGIALTPEDRLRRAVIEHLMCERAVDLTAVAAAHERAGETFAAEIAALAPMVADGLVAVTGARVTVLPAGYPLVRSVAAAFDAYLATGERRHARAL